MKFLLFPLLFSLLPFASPLAAESKFVHPGIAHSSESLAFIRSQIKTDSTPQHQAWEKMQTSCFLDFNWVAAPLPHVKRGPYNNPNIGSTEFSYDGIAAYTHALNWALSQKEESAQKAAEILDAWSATLETVTEHDARLLIGMSGLSYIVTAELLTHTWDGWSSEGQVAFKKMLREIWYPVIKDFYPSANGNWDASMLQTMLAMGVFLDDHEMFDRAAHYYTDGKGNGAVDNYFMESGECQESGRDQAHTQMGLEFLVNTCEIAWIQGLDLYGAHDNRLLKGFEYTAKYNLGNDVPYQPYESFQGRYFYKEISKDSRHRLRRMYEKPLNHYRNRKGLSAPFTEEAALKNRPESTGPCSLPWSTLMFAELPHS